MKVLLFFILAGLAIPTISIRAQETLLSKEGIHIIPYPREVRLESGDFLLARSLSIVVDKNASENDRFAAGQLLTFLRDEWDIDAKISNTVSDNSITLTRKGTDKKTGPEGYQLSSTQGKLTVRAGGEAGLFYGVQTIMQLIRRNESGTYVKGMEISDWPDTKTRAVHYDTKHHQDTREYVEKLIRDLSRYKINMLIWEWEDKLAYNSYREIGAPGAFSIQEMQALTRYAKQYHVQLVPLVQGLGHVSFILKWPQHAGLREIDASNFEFCPLKDSSYILLFKLWDEAIRATPGSSYFHIGSDETYELGQCEQCNRKAKEIGTSGLYHLFISKAAAHLQKSGRKVMAWESPMNWKQGKNAGKDIKPQKGLVLTESYSYETPDLRYAKEASAEGYPVFAYDPNPGTEPLFLPYFYKQDDNRKHITGSLEDSYNFLTTALGKGIFEGVIRTSWDDSGLPVQAWMLQFAATAAYSWNVSAPALPEFTSTFFRNYYGETEKDIQQLFHLLNEGAYYYSETLERNVWHFGSIGKTHLPDLPRADALEFDPYWNIEYADQLKKAGIFLEKMTEAIRIGKANLDQKIKNRHDIELFISIAELIRHTALTYLDLSELETAITKAHRQRFLSHDSTFFYLEKAESIVESNFSRRNQLYKAMVVLWEKTRLPKGMSTPDKKYFFRQDRTRHYANRTPDMKYLIKDEEDLDLEGYLKRLKAYKVAYAQTFMGTGGETTNSLFGEK